MILVRLMGGLGNQMFQYAFAKAVSLDRGVELALDASLLDAEQARAAGDTVRDYEMHVFGLPDRIASVGEVVAFNGATNPTLFQRIQHRMRKSTGRYPLVLQNGHDFDEQQIQQIGNSACLVGRWQSERYFASHADEIRRLFGWHAFKPNAYSLRLAEDVDADRDVVVQVRRGDQVTHPVYRVNAGAYTAEFYHRAMDFHRQAAGQQCGRFFIVSDDIPWCRDLFGSRPDVVLVEQENSKIGNMSDLWLMTRFRHFVISNSTFGWWGAWLGERTGSRVVAPETWGRKETNRPPFLIPDRWCRMRSDFEPLA